MSALGWSATPWVVAACVLVAVLVLPGRAGRRLAARKSVQGSVPRGRLSSFVTSVRDHARLRTARPGPADVATLAGELAVLLRAGLPPAAAWRALPAASDQGELGAAVSAAARAAAEAGDVAAALRHAVGGGNTPETPVARAVRALAATWHVAVHTGAPTADVLDRFAASLRDDADAADARDAALAAPRATARLLVGLPPAGLLLGWLVGADPFAVLFGSLTGRLSAAFGAACAVSGWWWTRRLLAAAERPDAPARSTGRDS